MTFVVQHDLYVKLCNFCLKHILVPVNIFFLKIPPEYIFFCKNSKLPVSDVIIVYITYCYVHNNSRLLCIFYKSKYNLFQDALTVFEKNIFLSGSFGDLLQCLFKIRVFMGKKKSSF